MESLSTSVASFLGLTLKAALMLLFIFITTFIKASYISNIVINEVAWMGTEASYNDEWVELYNNTDLPISLDGWSLKAADGNLEINLTGTIPGRGFYLLERTDDSTIPNILADQIYTGALSNKGKFLQLVDGENNLINEINCSQGWFSGDNSTKQTMERKNSINFGDNSENWQTSQNPGGTPKAQNSTTLEKTHPSQAESERLSETEFLQATTYPLGIVFNEILPSPEGPDDQEEWIEILNKNDFEVDLSKWKVLDTIGTTNTYIFPDGIKIKAKGFLILSRIETKITLNNSGDGLILVQPNDNLIDSMSYKKALLGQSYSLTGSEWVWTSILTPGNINSLNEEKNGDKEDDSEKQRRELAAVGNQDFEEGLGFFNVSLIALVLAVFSGIAVLFFKNKISFNSP